MKAYLQLENGVVFEGKAFGYISESIGEVVFNTGMTGYQEVLTDPSYYGQIVTMTYPLIGNYGINLEDVESDSPKVSGFIVREKSDNPNNFRCEMEIEGYLKYHKIMGLEGIDTRALTKILRQHGTMKGIISIRPLIRTELKAKLKTFNNKDAVYEVGVKEKYTIEGSGKHIAVMDFGIKENIIRSFKKRSCKLTILPANTSAEEILEINPDGIFLSNGPGDPADLSQIATNIRNVVEKKPVMGICLGHQLIAIAMGGKTEKLKFGHRGCNHPVKDLIKDKVYISSQNHGYVVSELPENMEITHISLNDNSVEGMKHKKLPIYSVQFHPEAAPGPQDAGYIFDEFLNII